MGKHFSKRVQEKKPSKATQNLPESKSENKSNNNKQPEQKTLDREFDDTPIPEPYNAPNDSPYLTILPVKKAIVMGGYQYLTPRLCFGRKNSII